MSPLWRTLAVCFLTALPALSQAQTTLTPAGSPPIDPETAHLTRFVTAVRITDEITVDGYLDEPAWDRAVPATDFVQWRPFHGELATQQTEARFLYDEDNLYVGFICFDDDIANRVVNEMREDFFFLATDGISIAIDSLNDDRSGFLFGTNPAGAKRDMQIAENSMNSDWDGVWDAKVSTNNEGWIAEFVIPFKTLRFTDPPSQEWGVNIHRLVLRTNEESSWAPIPVRYRGLERVSQFGTLRGLENIRQGRNLQVKPFVTARFSEARPTTDPFGTLGADQDFDGGVDTKYSLTPSLTLDATYRTDFAQVEVDQQQVNLTRFNLFFPEKRDFFLENASIFAFGPPRRRSNLVPFFSRRIGLSEAGIPIPIIGGARVSGQLDRYDVGLLAMRTERKGSTPSNNYLVGRVKRKLLSNSWVGMLVTNRDSTIDGDYNRLYGADAYFRFYEKLEFDSYILRSDTPGRAGQNLARRFQTRWRDDELIIGAEYSSIQTNFNPEVGFVRRTDVTQYSGEFSWNPLLRRNNTIRNLKFGTNVDYFAGSKTGQIETRTESVTLGLQFQSNASIDFNIVETFDRLTQEDRILGLPISAGDYAYRRYSVSTNSNQSQKISGNGTIDWGEFWDGHRKSFSGGLSLKPNHHWNLGLNYMHNRVALPSGRTTADLMGARFLYAFTPDVFLNAFLQYNAADHQFGSNIRFSLRYRPLSDLYLVYNDLRDTDRGELVQRAFIIKLTNLLSF